VRCPTCSKLYKADTYQLIRAGLAGGKGVPATVASHPCVFVTLTAPSFGVVHTTRLDAQGRELACRPRRDGGECEHGTPMSCPMRHGDEDPRVGQPLCAACYDYIGAVLWQAHAGRLWDRFADRVRREVAGTAGVPVRRLPEQVIVSFARVVEFQRRGLVHVHAVVRLDGPGGPSDTPPAWATVELLSTAVIAAHASAHLETPHSRACGEYDIRWGRQLDIRPIEPVDMTPGDTGPTRHAVAAYVAKYATTGAEDAGIMARPIRSVREVARLDWTGVSPHARRMVLTSWRLGGLPEFAHLRLRAWAHMLGYRGHFGSRSRRYSTTLGALRDARAAHRQAARLAELGLHDRPLAKVGNWRYAGHGHSVVNDDPRFGDGA
jgi:hypothetical protein